MWGAGWGPRACSSVMAPCGTVSLTPSYFLLEETKAGRGRGGRREEEAQCLPSTREVDRELVLEITGKPSERAGERV